MVLPRSVAGGGLEEGDRNVKKLVEALFVVALETKTVDC